MHSTSTTTLILMTLHSHLWQVFRWPAVAANQAESAAYCNLIEVHLEHVFSLIQDIVSQRSRPRQDRTLSTSGQQWNIHHICCIREEIREDRGTFLHFLIGLMAAVFTLHKHAIQTLSISPSSPHHTFTQTQVPRHHHNISKHWPHSPTQYSHTIITNHYSILRYIYIRNTTIHHLTACI